MSTSVEFDDATASRWLVIDASRLNEVVVASVAPSTDPRITQTFTYPSPTLPTFTDVLMRFERETGARLLGTPCVLTIAGAVTGGSIQIARSRWTISRSGLAVMLGQPAIIINDVAARAWAALGGAVTVRNLRHTDRPELTSAGRRVLVTIEDGVGAAVIDVDQHGMAHVQDTEVGHAGFAPSDEIEDRLLAALRRGGGVASWERALLLDADAPEWQAAMPGSSRPDRLLRQAQLIGSFAGDLTLMYGAWQGTLMTGSKIPYSLATNAAFDAGFVGRRHFRRLIQDTPCWKIDQQDHALRGAAALLGRRHAESIAAGAVRMTSQAMHAAH